VFKTQALKVSSASPNPKQNNHFDCGLFVLLGIRLLSARKEHLSQAQSNELIPRFKQRVLAKLLASTLNPTKSHFDHFNQREAQTCNILPQLSPTMKVGDKRIRTTTGPSPQTNEGRNIAFTVCISDIDSSDELDESEGEGTQVKRPPEKASQKKSPEQVVATFGEEASMIKLLREAVAIARASQKGFKNSKMESM
jgi:hypothetical protein